MTMTAEELEQPYFIPTSENVSQLLAALRTAEAESNNSSTEHALSKTPVQPRLSTHDTTPASAR